MNIFEMNGIFKGPISQLPKGPYISVGRDEWREATMKEVALAASGDPLARQLFYGGEMETPKFSPSPWKIKGYAGEHDESGALIVDANGKAVASTPGGLRQLSPRKDWNRYYADARLIEASPSLYNESFKCFQDYVEIAEAFLRSHEEGVAALISAKPDFVALAEVLKKVNA